jgi:UDP-arabinose 4-epimerase
MAEKTILVTGGAGYIGSHACKALAQAGYEPVVYDNLCRGHREFVKWGPLEEGDVRDDERLRAVINRHKPSAAMHFAALALVGESAEDPLTYYSTNVSGSATLAAAMCASGVEKLVFSGTCAVYGIPDATPIAEDAPLRPINPYGRSKLMAENMLTDANTAHGLSFASLRYFNAAGADPDGEVGERHDPETHIVPNVLKVAAGESPTFLLNGDDYPTSDGTCIRDYVHVSDIADAHVRALQYLDDNPGGHIFNLGTGTGFSVREVINATKQVTERDIEVHIGPRRDGDPPALVADATRIQKECSWSPKRSSLETLISDAWAWHKNNGF